MTPIEDAPKVVSIPRKKPAAISLNELMNMTFEGENSIIGSSLLNHGSIMVLGGPPKTFKSFISKSMCYHLATGTPLFGVSRAIRDSEREFTFPVPTPQRVLLLEQEIGEFDLQARFRSMITGLSVPERTLCLEKIFIHSCDYNMKLDTLEGVKYIGELIGDLNPNVVVIDPLIEFHQGDENSAQDMALALHGLDQLRQKFLFSSILIHHTAKMQKGTRGPDNLRGSSVIFGKGDTFLSVVPVPRKDNEVKVSFTLRRGRPIAPVFLRINDQTLRTEFMFWMNTPEEKRRT